MTDADQYLINTVRGTITSHSTMPKPKPGEVIILGIPERNWPSSKINQHADRLREAFREIFPDSPVLVVDQDIKILLMQDPEACAMARDAIVQDKLTQPR